MLTDFPTSYTCVHTTVVVIDALWPYKAMKVLENSLMFLGTHVLRMIVFYVSKVGEIVPEELEKAGLPRTIRSRVQADLAQGKE